MCWAAPSAGAGVRHLLSGPPAGAGGNELGRAPRGGRRPGVRLDAPPNLRAPAGPRVKFASGGGAWVSFTPEAEVWASPALQKKNSLHCMFALACVCDGTLCPGMPGIPGHKSVSNGSD